MLDGTFVLADIGGYSTFLTDVGIAHAKEITSHLFNGLFEGDRDTWKVGNIEGDCLFLYSESRKSPGEVFTYLRRLYETFRESIEEIASGSTCRCGACDRSGDLTLKFVVHGGAFDTQEIAGRTELIGSDIVVAHRLLKNSVPVREYALVTRRLADIAETSGLRVTPGRDEYGDVGAIDYVYIDFLEVREAYERSRAIYLTEADADVAASIEIEAPPDRVWSVMMDADKAQHWSPTLIEVEALSGPRGQVGMVHTCLHGDIGGRIIHFRVACDNAGRRFTDQLSKVPVVEKMILTIEAKPSRAGTKFTIYYSLKGGTPMDEETKSLFLDTVRQRAENDIQGMKAFCEAEAKGQ
jgi:uncharacterized protein YndB with AHSA1/START domain